MAFKMRGFNPGKGTGMSSSFTKKDPPNKQVEIKNYIKNNMDKMSDKELMKKINSMSDGKTTYNWNPKTGEVESRAKSALKKKTDKDYEPQTQTRGYKGSEHTDSTPQTAMQKMPLYRLEGELDGIMDNEYMEAKERGDKSEVARYESQMNKLKKEIQRRKKS